MSQPQCCSRCGALLHRMKWNTSVDVAVCNNGSCDLFRSPMSIEKNTTLMDDLTSLVRAKVSKGGGRRARVIAPEEFIDSEEASSVAEDLQRLRERLSAQE